MNNTAEVYLWGTRVGIVHQAPEQHYSRFEYDREFIKNGVELSPIAMPLSNAVYSFPSLARTTFHGMPGLLADSLPDFFGNKVIERWLAEQNRSLDDFTAIDRLCYTGKRGMGALEYIPALSYASCGNEAINVAEMVKLATDVLKQREAVSLTANEELGLAQLVQVGSSAGGARAKAVIAWDETTGEIRSGQLDLGAEYDYWLMKFDAVTNNGDHGVKDSPEYTAIEYAYYLMAISCGIEMNECRLYSLGDARHFMTKRFDRCDGDKVHMQTLGAIAHIDYNEPGVCSYEHAAGYMKIMGIGYRDIEQFFRRMVFNVAAVNQDDHVKNVSFLMDRGGNWRLSPAYDLTFSYNAGNRWLSAHQMTINGKKDCISRQDVINAGLAMGIKKKKCENILEDVVEGVANFDRYADAAGLRENTVNAIKRVIDDCGIMGE